MDDKTTGRESHLRSFLKAFSWRILATFTTATVAYFVTGQFETAVKIGIIEFFIKLFVYYFHERAWQLVPRGAIKRILRIGNRSAGSHTSMADREG